MFAKSQTAPLLQFNCWMKDRGTTSPFVTVSVPEKLKPVRELAVNENVVQPVVGAVVGC